MSEKKYLTAEEILAKDDITFIEMDIPEWGGTLRFRALTADEALKFAADYEDEATKTNSIIRLLTLSVVDENGDRIFTEADIRVLRKKSWAVFLKVQDRVMQFNGMRTKGSSVVLKNG